MKSHINKCLLAVALVAAFSLKADDPEPIRYDSYPSSRPSSFSDCRDLNNDWPSPFTNAVCWSDGLEPHTGATYVAGKINGENSIFWTPIQNTDTTYDKFDTLILEEGTSFCIRHQSTRKAIFNDLRVRGSVSFYCPDVSSTVLGGKIHIADDANLEVASFKGRIFEVDSDISGGGNISFYTQSGTTAYKSLFYLYGVNTNFLGKISVSTRATSGATLGDKYSTLYINSATALGGNLPAFTYDALTLKYKSVLNVGSRNIELPSEANRGVLISTGGGRISVSDGGTFTVNWPVVMSKNAHFYKEGAGHLVLGSALQFLKSNGDYSGTTVPTSSNNDLFYYVDIREGTVSVTDCNAVNGACVAFSNDTALVMSLDTANDDLKKYGVRGDKTRYGTPFTTDVPIRITVADVGSLTDRRCLVPLVTVKNTYTNDVAAKLKVTLDFNGYELGRVRSAPADGIANATTFSANVRKPSGLVISIK